MNSTKLGFKNLYFPILFIFFIGGIVVQILASCSPDSGGGFPPSSSSVVDGGSSSSNFFETVTIGSQTWMAKNLDSNVPGSKCYGEGGLVYDNESGNYIMLSGSEVQANCAKHGRLYDWSTAMNLPSSCNSSSCSSQIQSKHQGICPSGWYIPSNDDWDKLFRWVDGENNGEGSEKSHYDSYTAGRYLKATSGWNYYDGVSGNGMDKYNFSALPGGYGYSGGFGNVGYYGNWWSSSESFSNIAYSRYMDYGIEYAGYNYDVKGYLFSVRCLQN